MLDFLGTVYVTSALHNTENSLCHYIVIPGLKPVEAVA